MVEGGNSDAILWWTGRCSLDFVRPQFQPFMTSYHIVVNITLYRSMTSFCWSLSCKKTLLKEVEDQVLLSLWTCRVTLF